MKRKKSEADWAVEVLMEKQEPMYYLDIIHYVENKMKKQFNLEELTSAYTRMNMDNRVEYRGEGMWYYVDNRTYREE